MFIILQYQKIQKYKKYLKILLPTVRHHTPLLSFLTAPLNQLLVLVALYGKLPAMFGDHFPMLISIQGSLV